MKRTTLDLWDIQVNYGKGWETETQEFSWFAAKEQIQTYRDNVSYPVRAVKRRDKLSNYSPEQLADIAREIEEAKQRHRVHLVTSRIKTS